MLPLTFQVFHFFTCLTMFFSLFWLCYHFLYFSYLGHFDHVALTFQVFFTFLRVWPCFFTVLALCYQFLYFLTLVILTMLHSLFRFSSLFTCLTMFFHSFGPLLPLFIFFLPWSFDHVALTFQVYSTFYVSDHVFSLFWPSATTFYIFLTLVILTMLHSLFRLFHNAIRCLSTSATMWHIFKSVRAILSELQPLFFGST